MRIIALDASTEQCSVALGDGASWRERVETAGHRHSELLLPMLQQLLAQGSLTLADVDGIAFGAGPGSFTGLRIACGVAQGLGFGRGIPVVGISTLEAMAEIARLRFGATRVIAALDARMHEVYLAACEHDGTRWQETIEAMVVKPADAPLPPAGDWLGAGPGFVAYPALAARLRPALSTAARAERFGAMPGAPAMPATPEEILPTASAIGALALRRFAAGEGVAARDAAPLYVRQRVALTTAERAAGARP